MTERVNYLRIKMYFSFFLFDYPDICRRKMFHSPYVVLSVLLGGMRKVSGVREERSTLGMISIIW